MNEHLPRILKSFRICGSCEWWLEFDMGQGHCKLADEVSAPIRTSDPGAVVTRIDFGCNMHRKAKPQEAAGG